MIPIASLPHVDARRLLATGAPAWLFINPVEYHGPHLSLHNDALVSRALATRLHLRLFGDALPLLAVDDLEIGVDPTPGPGTRHTRFATARSLVREACRALVELGARRVILMTFHGAPLHALAVDEGIAVCREAGVPAVAPFNLVLQQLLDLDEARYASALGHLGAEDRRLLLDERNGDFHAGFFETSVSLALAPAAVSSVHRALPPCPAVTPDAKLRASSRLAERAGAGKLAAELGFAATGVGWRALRPFPGYTGRPHLANAASGEAFADLILDEYARHVPAVLDGSEPSPAPILAWVGRVSLGGRIGQPSIPTADQILDALTRSSVA